MVNILIQVKTVYDLYKASITWISLFFFVYNDYLYQRCPCVTEFNNSPPKQNLKHDKKGFIT